MSTQGRVQAELEALVAKHGFRLSDDSLMALLSDVADTQGPVWSIIFEQGRNEGWEQAEELIEQERAKPADHTRCRGVITNAIGSLAWSTGWLEAAMQRYPNPKPLPPFLQKSLDNMLDFIGELDEKNLHNTQEQTYEDSSAVHHD